METDSRSEKKIFLRFAGYFVFLINGFGCGYARFQGAVQGFSEHQKNRKTIDNSLRKLNFSARPCKSQIKYKCPIIFKGNCTVIDPH